MLRSRLKQDNGKAETGKARAERRREQFSPIVRSPALEAAEQQRSTQRAKRPMERQQRAPRLRVTAVASRKRTGLAANWRLGAPRAQERAAPVQVMSEEEQKKLAELEMHLSRVAGKIDSWLLILV
ncbi:MAG: hypothetical protein JO202_16495, partial [Ktedonobacteraceae bacterium]|nr:hypothetical protein [Ktedonobacteraceae bacterium]